MAQKAAARCCCQAAALLNLCPGQTLAESSMMSCAPWRGRSTLQRVAAVSASAHAWRQQPLQAKRAASTQELAVQNAAATSPMEC